MAVTKSTQLILEGCSDTTALNLRRVCVWCCAAWSVQFGLGQTEDTLAAGQECKGQCICLSTACLHHSFWDDFK